MKNTINQITVFNALHRNRSPLKLYGLDDGHLWDLAGEIANSKNHKLREKAEQLIQNTLTKEI